MPDQASQPQTSQPETSKAQASQDRIAQPVALGIWTEQYGGRVMFPITMLCSAVATWLLSTVSTYPMMLFAALGVGLAGGSFAVSIPLVAGHDRADRAGLAAA